MFWVFPKSFGKLFADRDLKQAILARLKGQDCRRNLMEFPKFGISFEVQFAGRMIHGQPQNISYPTTCLKWKFV